MAICGECGGYMNTMPHICRGQEADISKREQVKLHVSESTATIRQWIENGTWQLMVGKSLMIAITDELDANRLRIAELEAENRALRFKGVGEQHVYPVPRKNLVREGD